MLFYNKQILSWRQQYNPLRQLTVARLIYLLEAAERGIYADIQWLYRFIEKRDATIRALLQRRRSAIEKLDWDVRVKERYSDSKAAAQRDALKESYEMIDNLREAIDFLALAEFRGYSHLEKHYNADGDVFHLEPVEQWYWARRMPRRDWLYNKRAQSTDNGFKIDPRNFVIREVDYAINEVGVICYLRKSLSLKDWDAYIETYGLPPLFIEMPEHAPISATAQYQEMAEKIIGDMRGTLPPGAKIQSVNAEAGVGINSPFHEHVDYQDSQIVMAGTGGKLTMLNDPTGLGSGQSEVHAATFDEIAKAEAKQINEVFQKQMDSFVLNALFPGEEHMVYFALEAEDDIDVDKLVANAVQLNSANWRMDSKELSEKTGLTLEDRQQEIDQQQQQMMQQQGGSPSSPEDKFVFRNRHLEANASRMVSEALDREYSDIVKRLRQASEIEDDVIRNSAIRRIKLEIPRLLKDLNRVPSAAKPLANAMSTAFVEGVSNENTEPEVSSEG